MQFVNRAWQLTLGATPESREDNFFSLIHTSDTSEVRRHFAMLQSSKRPTLFEARCRARGGTYRTVTWNCRADSESGVIYLAGRDVTKRKHVEQTLRGSREMIIDRHRQAALAEMELSINEPHQLQVVLDRVCDVTTQLLPATAGASIILWDRGAEDFVISSSTVPRQDPQEGAKRVRRKQGATRWIVDQCKPLVVETIQDDPFTANAMLREGDIGAYVGVPLVVDGRALGVLYALDHDARRYDSSDVGFLASLACRAAGAVSRVQLYEELREANALLAASETALQDKNTELARSNKELQEFAYVVSHDLKAPLRGINQLAEWISADHTEQLGDGGAEKLALLLDRAQRMNELIDGILSYSRVGRGHAPTVRVDLNRLVREVADMLAEQPSGEINTHDLPTVLCQPTQIRQLFQNLLENAIKYGDKPQTHIDVRCEPVGGSWQFSVTDNGPGIEARHFESIFKMFRRGAAREDQQGTGVGLALARKIVEIHGGHMKVESVMGQGTCMVFTLPRSSTESCANGESGECPC